MQHNVTGTYLTTMQALTIDCLCLSFKVIHINIASQCVKVYCPSVYIHTAPDVLSIWMLNARTPSKS